MWVQHWEITQLYKSTILIPRASSVRTLFVPGSSELGPPQPEFLRYNASDIMLIHVARRDSMELKMGIIRTVPQKKYCNHGIHTGQHVFFYAFCHLAITFSLNSDLGPNSLATKQSYVPSQKHNIKARWINSGWFVGESNSENIILPQGYSSDHSACHTNMFHTSWWILVVSTMLI